MIAVEIANTSLSRDSNEHTQRTFRADEVIERSLDTIMQTRPRRLHWFEGRSAKPELDAVISAKSTRTTEAASSRRGCEAVMDMLCPLSVVLMGIMAAMST
eukprot:1752095-Amphidinium_carterae.1